MRIVPAGSCSATCALDSPMRSAATSVIVRVLSTPSVSTVPRLGPCPCVALT